MAQPELLTRLKPLYIQNRKYIGSKHHLLEFIAGIVAEKAPEARSFADLFAGTGVVAHHFARAGMAVTAADTLYHNYLAARCFMGGEPGEVDWDRMAELLAELDQLEPREGYCTHWYGGSYFTYPNAGRIDAIRESIAYWAAEGDISPQEEAVLLTSLLYGADKVANTCGQYDAFLKHLGSSPYSAEGVHRVDSQVYKPLRLGLPQVIESGNAQIRCADAAQVVAEGEWDVLYLDPPYNTRQYVDNYHVLENIARWTKPLLMGKTRKFPRQELKSPYSTRRHAASHMQQLISQARARHILISYNNEGIIPDELILQALNARGETQVFTRTYAIFGNGAGRSNRRPILERVFYCRVTS
ncbi:MAG: DNA adenine methylase [Mycobacterium leprae]